MKKRDIRLLANLLHSSENEVYGTCYEHLLKRYKPSNIVTDENFIYAIGTTPILLVAHLDTVWLTEPTILVNSERTIWTGKNGLGADDRAGVYAILKILEDKKVRPSILFTLGEEIGCVGAISFIAKHPVPMSPVKYVIEIDRRGHAQSVFYDCKNTKFEEYINSFGFTTQIGIYSDISHICPNWDIAGVNLSAGYYNEHTAAEILYIDALEYTIEKVKEMLHKANSATPYKFYEDEKQTSRVANLLRCPSCKEFYFRDCFFDIDSGEKICIDCVAKKTVWCSCGKVFLPKDKKQKECEECLNAKNKD